MKNGAYVHWDQDESSLFIKNNVYQPVKLKAELFDRRGTCILPVFDKFCQSGEFTTIKKIKDLAKGYYMLKFSYNTTVDCIRFKI